MNILKASRRASAVVAACLLFADMAGATPLTYQGTFSADDEHASVPINLSGPGTLTTITSSWALGGFAPVLALFGGAAGYQQDVGNAKTCGATLTTPLHKGVMRLGGARNQPAAGARIEHGSPECST